MIRNRHGQLEDYYENGSLEYKLNYKNGKRHGFCEHYFWDGQTWWKGEYKNGKERGLWYEYELSKQVTL